MIWRRSDWLSAATLVIVVTWIFYAGSKANSWDGTTLKVEDKTTGLQSHETRMTVLEKGREDDRRILYAIAEAVGAKIKIKRPYNDD